MAEEVMSYTANALLECTNRDLMMVITGDIYKTYEVSPEHISRTVKKLDESYEGTFTDPWELEYSLEHGHVYASLEKNYANDPSSGERNHVTLDPSHKLAVSPITEENLELEISGVLDIKPDDFLAAIN